MFECLVTCFLRVRVSLLCRLQAVSKIHKGKVFYGQEPPSGESTTTECGVNYYYYYYFGVRCARPGESEDTLSVQRPQPYTTNPWKQEKDKTVGDKKETTCSNVLKQLNGELLVAVNRNKLRTMASETVDPIDWSHPPPSWEVSPERLEHSINQCNLSGNRTCNRSMRGNHLAYAATQGMFQFIPACLIITEGRRN